MRGMEETGDRCGGQKDGGPKDGGGGIGDTPKIIGSALCPAVLLQHTTNICISHAINIYLKLFISYSMETM